MGQVVALGTNIQAGRFFTLSFRGGLHPPHPLDPQKKPLRGYFFAGQMEHPAGKFAFSSVLPIVF